MEAKENFTSMKSLERVVSEKAMKLGNSFPCQICVVGFLCGICLTSLFLATLASLGTFELAAFSFASSSTFPLCNSTSNIIKSKNKIEIEEEEDDDQVKLLVSAWDKFLLGMNKSQVPNAPHLENCEERSRVRERLDSGITNQTLPPWINGGDEENYPLTKRVQREIWIHQHPLDCRNKNLKFLVADWETLAGFGIGAQIAGMTGLLAIAMNENRVLVTNYYNRADHDGCKGSSRGSWSCYFLPETTKECKQQALSLTKKREAWKNGIITTKQNYTSKKIWSGPIPKLWGKPWNHMKPTTQINKTLLSNHRKMDRRWWRAQAVRYLMRFQTEYTCNLMNTARNSAFGKEAAKIVLSTGDWRLKNKDIVKTEIEEQVWSNHKPWRPKPLLSVHVRMGDKACEMRVAELQEYMTLANRIRARFPELNRIWLSTEMKEVIERSKEYEHWRFYYSEVKRQVGNESMAKYEASLGREKSTNYPLVNFLMASDSDFFVGALGSTWCFLIDGMRNTGGKVMSGYLSVNKDRFW